MRESALWYILVYTMFLLTLIRALERQKLAYALVGGYAVSLHGAVRGTLDVDIVIPHTKKSFVATEETLASIGLRPRLPLRAEEVFSFREEYIQNRNLTAWGFQNPGDLSQLVDVIITHDLRKMKTLRKKVKNTAVSLISIDDLIQMKRDSGRPQDLADVEALEKLQ